MSKMDKTAAIFDQLAQLPGAQVIECAQCVADHLNALEGKPVAWRRQAFEWFADRFNEAVLRRDLKDKTTKH